MRGVAGVLLTFFSLGLSKTYFKDTFETDPFSGRWTSSNWSPSSGEKAEFEWSSGLWTPDENRKGLRTPTDARFYAATAPLDEEFDNDGKTLVVQFSVKHEQKIDCGGGYLKLIPAGTNVADFSGDTEYSIMFGPDICGYSNKQVHTIFNFNGENLQKTDKVKCPDDEYTHVYTLVVNADESYDILVDGESKDSGQLKDGWKFEEPAEIPDPDAKKPEDWVDKEMMDDPEDTKPDDWDDEPKEIPDPDATKPEDWDEEDGEWEVPMIRNPEYKGKWRPKKIKNPDYKGKWEAPKIANPNYVAQSDVYKRGNLGFVGFELWQVKAGTVFSDIIVTDSLEEAQALAEERKVDRSAEEAAKKAYDDANAPEDEPEEDFEDEEDYVEEEDDKVEL